MTPKSLKALALSPVTRTRGTTPSSRRVQISTQSKLVQHLEHEGKLKVVYGRYELDKGVVDFL